MLSVVDDLSQLCISDSEMYISVELAKYWMVDTIGGLIPYCLNGFEKAELGNTARIYASRKDTIVL